jgi:hypothetical protein
MAVVATLELDDFATARVGAGGRRADIVASVPELTKRSISTDGIASTISAASSISSSLVAP